MPVNQVEEYYVHIDRLQITGSKKDEIEILLENEGYGEITWGVDLTWLVVDGIESERAGEKLEEKILELIA